MIGDGAIRKLERRGGGVVVNRLSDKREVSLADIWGEYDKL